jgi:hypothetical protein
MHKHSDLRIRVSIIVVALLFAVSGIGRAQSAPISFDALPRAQKVVDTTRRVAPVAKRAVRVDTVRVTTVDTIRVTRVDTVVIPRSEAPRDLHVQIPRVARDDKPTFASPSVSGLLQVQLSGGDAAALKSTYRIRRVEIKVVSDLGRKAQAILMIDPSKALALTTSGTTTSVNRSSLVLQDAFLAVPVRGVSLELGQQRLPLGHEGSHSSSQLETIDRALMQSDRARGGQFGDVRDLGFMARGKWSRLEYRAGLFNGSGENMNDTDRNVSKVLAGHATVTVPFVPGLRLGASAVTSGAQAGDNPTRDRVGAHALYLRGALHVQVEAMGGQDAAVRREGMYALAGYNVTKTVKLLTRFDAWDPNTAAETAASDVTERDYLAGVTWLPSATRLKLQLGVVRKTYTQDITPAVTHILSQLQASW